jgi:Putative auto-transporter adhesin, head GIN domain
MRFRLITMLGLLCVSTQAFAADRKFTIGSFTDLVVDGDMIVRLDTDKAPSAKAQGSNEALAALKVERQGNVVFVRNTGFQAGRSSGGPVTVTITGRDIRRISLTGSGKIIANALNADNSRIELRGAGSIDVGSVNAFRLAAVLSGNGTLNIAKGAVVNSDVAIDGGANFLSAGLVSQNLKLVQNGPASTLLTVSNVAEISNNGSGSITIEGEGSCMIRKGGSATINCKKISQ